VKDYPRKQQGFSIVEIVVGLVILAILIAAISPFFTNYFTQNRLKGAAETLYDNVTFARTTAIKTATQVTLTITTGASWCYGMASGVVACTCTSAPSAANCDLGIVSSTDYPGTSLASTITSPTTFNAIRGTPNNIGTATFSTSTPTRSVQLSLSAMGTSSLCSPSGTVGGYSGC
jgi:prepilin-type N-terminal cleavage/methylation domain-containing protein